jgi:hypothetical protein
VVQKNNFQSHNSKNKNKFEGKGKFDGKNKASLMRVRPLGPRYLPTRFLLRKKPARRIQKARKAQHFNLE